jgi:hypothetical protein
MSQNTPPAEIADLLQENRSFAPSAEFQSQANVRDDGVYARAEKDSGPASPRSWSGFRNGQRFSTGNRRTRNGSSAAL